VRPVRIDFIDDKKWRAIWIITGAVLALVLIAYLALAHQNTRHQNELHQELESLRTKMLAQASARPADKRHAHALIMARLLQTDYNKVFQALETLKEPGIRLRQLHVDSATGRVRVEYEFENLDKISMISGHLNSGYSTPPWQFEGSSTNSGSIRSPAILTNQQTIRGTWSCLIDLL
jgi:type II secretory pathway component PulL